MTHIKKSLEEVLPEIEKQLFYRGSVYLDVKNMKVVVHTDEKKLNLQDNISNQEYILKIIQLAQKHEGYWFFDQSESDNGEVKVSIDGVGIDQVEFYRKRVYDYKKCYEELLKETIHLI